MLGDVFGMGVECSSSAHVCYDGFGLPWLPAGTSSCASHTQSDMSTRTYFFGAVTACNACYVPTIVRLQVRAVLPPALLAAAAQLVNMKGEERQEEGEVRGQSRGKQHRQGGAALFRTGTAQAGRGRAGTFRDALCDCSFCPLGKAC